MAVNDFVRKGTESRSLLKFLIESLQIDRRKNTVLLSGKGNPGQLHIIVLGHADYFNLVGVSHSFLQ